MAKGLARLIRTKRDYQSATAVAAKLRQQNERETAAERRLQALLQEIERFDGEDADEEDVDLDVADGIDDLPRRRWSDESE